LGEKCHLSTGFSFLKKLSTDFIFCDKSTDIVPIVHSTDHKPQERKEKRCYFYQDDTGVGELAAPDAGAGVDVEDAPEVTGGVDFEEVSVEDAGASLACDVEEVDEVLVLDLDFLLSVA